MSRINCCSPFILYRVALAAISLLPFAFAPGSADPRVPTTASGALLRQWTFEQPGYGSQTSNIADHCLILYEGEWHLFHTHIATLEQPQQYIGHAVSTNLREWTERTPVLVAEPGAPAWRCRGVWAPYVVADPLGGFVMAFTGVEMDLSQRIGFLRSADLSSWQEVAASPLEPDPAHYAWSPDGYSSFRDPHLLHSGGEWHLLFAARTAGDSTSAVGHATSSDLVTWQQHPALMTEGAAGGWPDLESPGMLHRDGRFHLFYSYQGVRLTRSTQFTGPWPGEEGMQLDPLSSAGELVPSGGGLLFSRRRSDPCRPGSTIVWIDSLNATQWPLQAVSWPRLPGWVEETGDGFAGQPTFGDGAMARGETPSEPSHLFLLSSRENHPEPSVAMSCMNERGGTPRGLLRSAPFVLEGDTAVTRIGGADSPDSVFVRLRDACTNRIYASFTGGSATLERKSAPVAAGWGGEVEWLIEDRLERPGGWLETDDLEILAAPGLPSAPSPPPIGWLSPVGGEDLAPRDRINIYWSSGSAGTLDSLVLYLTYDEGRTLRRLNKFDGGKTWTKWTVPDTVTLDARLRIVAYANSGARACATTGPLMIGRTVSVELLPPLVQATLQVRYGAGGPWLEGVVPAAPGQEADALLELFDLRGRRLAEVWRGAAGARFRVAVPRLGEGGRALPSGIVFARLRGAGARATATVWLPPLGD